MARFLILVSLVFATGFVAFRGTPQVDIQELQRQRIELLTQRVAAIQTRVDEQRVGAIELIRPEMDLLNARLEYATTTNERKSLLAQLLEKYDQLIESTKLMVANPGPPRPDSQQQMMENESELYFLKSERIRIQILYGGQD